MNYDRQYFEEVLKGTGFEPLSPSVQFLQEFVYDDTTQHKIMYINKLPATHEDIKHLMFNLEHGRDSVRKITAKKEDQLYKLFVTTNA